MIFARKRRAVVSLRPSVNVARTYRFGSMMKGSFSGVSGGFHLALRASANVSSCSLDLEVFFTVTYKKYFYRSKQIQKNYPFLNVIKKIVNSQKLSEKSLKGKSFNHRDIETRPRIQVLQRRYQKSYRGN